MGACSHPVDTSAPASDSSSTATTTPTAAADTVTLHGVSIALPNGWARGTPTLCGHAVEHTVTVYTGAPRVASCPAAPTPQRAVEAVALVEIFGPWGASPWTGTRTSWEGQPAWIAQYGPDGAPVTLCASGSDVASPCPSGTAADAPLTTMLALPWLNATVVVSGATATRTQELLGLVTVHAQLAVTVPAAASRMTVSWATEFQRPATTTSQSDIEPALVALRALPTLSASAACQVPAALGPTAGGKVVTFESSNGVETSFLVTLAPCDEVMSGTGAASLADQTLYAALAKVPLPAVR
jgi:hypothetical protein